MRLIIVVVALGLALASFFALRLLEPDAPLARDMPVRWDEADGSQRWTSAALRALEGHGSALVQIVPDDIENYCQAYAEIDQELRKAFWVNLIASLSFHESTWRQNVSGGEGRWHGLLQIAPATARAYGCRAQDEQALKIGSLNLACGIRIMAVTVPRDGVISKDMKGIAADWGPFHQERKRVEIQNFTKALEYCQL